MFREIITESIAARNITKNKLGTMAGINRPCLFRFLAGEPTLGLASVEKIFRVLSLHVVDKRGKFVYYGYDLRNAVARSLQESGTLKKNMCAKIGMAQPNLTAFLNGRATSRPLMVERMLQVLDLFIKETEPPQTLPPLKVKQRTVAPYQICNAIYAALQARKQTPYRFAKDNGISTGNLCEFLNKGTALGSKAVEKIINALYMHISDGTHDYGADIRAAVLGGMATKGTNAHRLSLKLGFSNALLHRFLKGGIFISVPKLDAVFTELGLVVA